MQQYPRLKVEDALSYLDRVKQQFCLLPHVYNDFLDIMKEFKSQTIDTPGVIARVSSLFQGHKDLIVGFNTFLPPGYKIELNKATDTINIFQPGHRGGTPTHMTLSSFETMHSNKEGKVGEALTNNKNSPGKPVEFNHAIHYVNKIKSRYQNRPEIYKAFLEILHHYQKDDKSKDDNNATSIKLTEAEVLSKVAKLFKDQPDLLKEFGQFLPDATIAASNNHESLLSLCSSTVSKKIVKPESTVVANTQQRRKRMSSIGSSSSVASKKLRQDMRASKEFISEIGKYGSLLDFAFFDKVRKMLGDVTYMEFLKCLKLYCINDLHMTSNELMAMIQPFCVKMPELKRRIKDLMRKKNEANVSSLPAPNVSSLATIFNPSIKRSTRDRSVLGEFAGEIDYASCKRLDVSYLAIPRGHIPPKCSGRTPLCYEVLNDTYVSFPSWSEDSSSVIKKTMAEEQLFKCEEDRCQLDVVLDNFVSTCEVLMLVHAKMERMTKEESAVFRLDNCLGGHSEFLHRKTLQRLYGDKGNYVIEALKQNPLVVVPIVLNRLQSKIDEWRDARRHNSRNWNEINQRYYLKSLDHQGLTVKQTDAKILRSKALLTDIEAAFAKRQEHGLCENERGGEALYSIVYNATEEEDLMADAAALIIHHVKRQTNINAVEKRKMKQFLHRFLPDLLYTTRGQLSDDEAENEIEVDGDGKVEKDGDRSSPNQQSVKDQQSFKTSVFIVNSQVDEHNNRLVFYANSHFFIFLRLHCILCDRLCHLKKKARIIAAQHQQDATIPSVAVAIRLKTPSTVNYSCLYVELLRMVANLMDGLLEPATYEEQLREMFVTDACIAYTIDKLIHTIVRQLQHLVSDESCLQLFELFRSEREDSTLKGAAHSSHATTLEILYQHRAIQALYVDEKCFKFITNRGVSRVDVDMLCGRSDDDLPIAVKTWVDEVASWIPVNQDYKKPATFLSRNLLTVDASSIKYATRLDWKGDDPLRSGSIDNPRDIFVFRKLYNVDRAKRTMATALKRSKRFDNFVARRLQLFKDTTADANI